MRNVISGITGLASMLLCFFGLIICSCDAPDWERQVTIMMMGISLLVVGALFGVISAEVANGNR